MTYPTFTSGDVLLASDMNAVGLWLVKTQTVGSAVSSVTVTGAFSSTYDGYVITDTGGTMSADTAYGMTFGSAATNYYYFLTYGSYTSATVQGDNGNNTTKFAHAGGGANRSGHIIVLNPNIAKPTDIVAKVRYGTVYGTEIGHLGDFNQYTAFTITPASGTMTGGTIRVYGYRN
jgi:hypothetical protein